MHTWHFGKGNGNCEGQMMVRGRWKLVCIRIYNFHHSESYNGEILGICLWLLYSW